MKNFSYVRADSVGGALSALARTPGAKFLGGGTNLVDLMREGIEQPDAVIDVTHLSTDIEDLDDGGLRIGTGVKNTAVAQHITVRERFPVLQEAILLGASGQIRNMATVGGNLMQRTRCYYFYDDAARCNKRQPGAGCAALDGFNRIHAVLGASEHCVATHPSDMCVALAALDATVHVQGPRGARRIPMLDFHRLPGDTPQIDTNLQPDELIASVELPALPFAANSLYRKVRDRSSYAFALVSVAAAVEVEEGLVKQVRLALGGMAHKPWRALEAERVLQRASATIATFREAVRGGIIRPSFGWNRW